MASNNTPALIGDAIVAEINDPARSWAGTFTAVRTWLPIFNLKDLSYKGVSPQPQLSVVPDSMPTDETLTRGLQQQMYEMYIVLQTKVPDQTNGSIDPWATWLETVKDWFFRDRHPLATFNTRCQGAAILTYCWRPHLEEFQAYTGVVNLTFEVDQ